MPTSSLTLQRLVDVTLGGDFAISTAPGPAPAPPPPPPSCPVIPPSVLFFDDFREMALNAPLANRVPVKSPANAPWTCDPSVALADVNRDIVYGVNDGLDILVDPSGAGMLSAACFEIKFFCVAPIGVGGFEWKFTTDASDQAFRVFFFSSQEDYRPDYLQVQTYYTGADGEEKTTARGFLEIGADWITFRMEFPVGNFPQWVINGTPYPWYLSEAAPVDLASPMHMSLSYSVAGATTGPIITDYVGVSTNVAEDFVALLCKFGP